MTGAAWDSDDPVDEASEREERRRLKKEWAKAPTNPRLPGEDLGQWPIGGEVLLYRPVEGNTEAKIRASKNIIIEVGRPGVGVEGHHRQHFAVRCREDSCEFEASGASEHEIAGDAIDHRHQTGHAVERISPDEILGGDQ